MAVFPPPPVRTPFADQRTESGISRPWMEWFQTIAVQLATATPVVTGSKGGNAALTSLLAVLKAKGIVFDQTT
jgi:hypothetical protein